jgi:hypothetical protein
MAFFVPIALGATASWMPLLATSFLIGSWLLFPRSNEANEIFDPGAEEMPRSNQALRGVTVAVLFGTNRVSSNITWTKNWNVIRHETSSSGAGSKGGGSGGSKMPEQPGQVSYTYTWDIMLTLGMPPEPYSLYGGWASQQRLNDETIASIGQDFSFISFSSLSTVPDEATLQFKDAFYHAGFPTSVDADNWDYWETQEGFPCRWPHTVWLGFETLNLGNRAYLQTLEWEVGPGDAQFDIDSGFIDDYTGTNAGEVFIPHNNSFLRGEDGNRYLIGDEGGEAKIVRFTGAALTQTETLSTTEIAAAITALGLDEDGQGTREAWSVIENNDTYFMSYSQGGTTNLHSAQNIILWKINASGVAEAVGGYSAVMGPSLGYGFLPTGIGSVWIANEGTVNDAIINIFQDTQSGTVRPAIMTMPSIADMLTPENGGTGPYINLDQGDDEWFASYRQLHTVISANHGFHNRYGGGLREGNHWFVLPTATITELGITWGTQIKFYVGRDEIGWHEDNPGAAFPDVPSQHIYDNMATYPDGWIGSIDLGNVAHSDTYGVSPGSWAVTIDNANWVSYPDEEARVPFTGQDGITALKEGYDKDGTTQNDLSTYFRPTVQKATSGILQGGSICIWVKQFNPKAENSTTGDYIGARVFAWQPIIQKGFELTSGIEGTNLDVVADLGADEADRYASDYNNTRFIWDQTEQSVYKIVSQNSAAGEEFYISSAADLSLGGAGDVLPPYIIYQILTNPVFGMGVLESDVDTQSYEAALTYCRGEDFWVSVQYTRESSKLEIIEEILSIYGGYLSISGGKIKFGLMDTSTTPVRTIDNDHLVREGDSPPVMINKSAKDDRFNKVIVNYIDRSLEYRQNQIEVNDEVDQDLRGVFKKEFPSRFVMSEATATKIGLRSLWSNLYGEDSYSFAVGAKDQDLEAGDVITLVDSFHPNHAISSGIKTRIVQVQERRRGKWDITAVDEIDYIATAVDTPLGVSSPGGRDPIYGPSRIPANQWSYELPREFQGATPHVYIGYNALSSNRGAWLYASDDGTSYAQVDNAEPFPISGILAAPLPTRPDGYMEQGVEIYLFPDTRSTDVTTSFQAQSPVYVNTFALEDLSAGGRQSGQATLIVGSEAMAYQGLQLLAQNHYRVDRLYRGWGGTHIQAHNSGAYWHKHGGGIFAVAYNEDRIGQTFSYKVVPYNFAGQGVDVTSVDASTHTIQGAYFLPQIQGTIHTFVHSADSGQSSVDLRANERLDVPAAGSDVDFTWSEAARLSGWGSQGFGTGGYGRFTQDIASPTYRVEVLSNDLSTVVRCEVVNTGFWTYSIDVNSTDFNGWNGDYLVKMTPYNEYGDAPRTATKRLRLF